MFMTGVGAMLVRAVDWFRFWVNNEWTPVFLGSRHYARAYDRVSVPCQVKKRFQVAPTSVTMATLRLALMHERSWRTNLFVMLLQQRTFRSEQRLLHHGLVVCVVDVHDSIVQSDCASRL